MEHVEQDTNLYTDAAAAYDLLGYKGFKHFVIDHAVAYAKGNVHTNTLENFWSLLKRSIKGTYVSVDPFHLFRYLDEQVFRFNRRENHDLGRFMTVLHGIVGRRLTYKDYISSTMLPATT
jgi:transposase-like protein